MVSMRVPQAEWDLIDRAATASTLNITEQAGVRGLSW
jgi:hypothetical protein